MTLEGLVHVGGPQDAIVEKGAGLACPRDPLTILEGTAQLRLTIPLVVTDGPIASFGGLSRAVSPDTQLLPAALIVLGTRLQGGGGVAVESVLGNLKVASHIPPPREEQLRKRRGCEWEPRHWTEGWKRP